MMEMSQRKISRDLADKQLEQERWKESVSVME